jgi:hypothetical protein
VLCNVAHWTSWNRHFGPLSGSDPKIENPGERYILTTFTYGCNLGPAQASRHLRGAVTPHMLSFINRRHANANKLNAALKDIINRYHLFDLPKVWGKASQRPLTAPNSICSTRTCWRSITSATAAMAESPTTTCR